MNDRVGAKGQLDIGIAIGAPFKDKEWLKKCAVIGLMMLIPIAGALNLSGWMRAIADKRMAGGPDAEILPEANLNYMGAGWRMFLAYLPVMLIVFGVMMIGGVAAAVAVAAGGRGGEDIALGIALVMYAGILVLALGMSIVGPAIVFLHIVEGEPWASFQFRRIWETMRAGGVQYLLLFVAFLVAGMVGQLGALACYVGMFVTIPMGQAMAAAAIAEYAKLVKPQETSWPIEGGLGGSSGTPFSVKS